MRSYWIHALTALGAVMTLSACQKPPHEVSALAEKVSPRVLEVTPDCDQGCVLKRAQAMIDEAKRRSDDGPQLFERRMPGERSDKSASR